MHPAASTTTLPATPRMTAARFTLPQAGLALAIGLLLVIFLVVPVLTVVYVAFTNSDGSITFSHFQSFFQLTLMREAFYNSLYVGGMSVLLSSVFALPLAYFTARFQFRGAILIQTLGVLPLIMPPFVGAAAMQLLFGRSGSVNLLLLDWFDFSIPFMEGLNAVIFVEALHYFPFILLNLSVALANIDSAMEESAQNLGASGLRLFRRIVFPLSMPGYMAGAALVFLKVFDDVATPLVLNVTDILAAQAYLRISSIGLDDPIGYVASVIMVAASLLALWGANRLMQGREYATLQRGGSTLATRKLKPWQAVFAYGWIALVLLLVLSPHFGILLLSFSKVWSYSVLPETFTLDNYATVFRESPYMLWNTALYCGIAAGLDVIIGTAIAYLMLRTRLPGRGLLDFIATGAVAIPGVVLGIGYLRTFRDLSIPFAGVPFTSFWLIIALALTVRRLPYALRSCVASLQQIHVSMEEAAQNLGANSRRTIARIVVPLMAGGILAGFVTSFLTAAVELSATIMLVSATSDAPVSYGIYLYMQSIAGRGPGAALGVIAVALVGVGTYVSHRIVRARHVRFDTLQALK
jgi:iron(III) transport system permease protein